MRQDQKCSIFRKIFLLMLASSAGPCVLFGLYELIRYHKVIYGKENPLMIVIGCSVILSIIVAGIITQDIILPIRSLIDAIKGYRIHKSEPNFSGLKREDEFGFLFEEYEKMVREVLKYQGQLAKNTRLAAIGEIVNHVAHDLRSPLQTLLGSIGKIEKKAGADGEVSAYADSARRAADRIRLMTEELLDYKKARELQLAPVRAEQIISESLKDVQAQAEQKGIKISTSILSQMKLDVDAGKLERVISNIVLNAIQAIEHEKGEIEIDVSPREEGGISITIKDNGCGIAAENISKVFDCSFTCGKAGGTGLGLAYCHNVIDAHKGTIRVESENGKGTSFIIELSKESVLEQGTNERIVRSFESGASSSEPAPNKEKQWLLVANRQSRRKEWRELLEKHSARIGAELERPEDLIHKNIDYLAIKGMIIDCELNDGGITADDVADMAMLASSKGIKNIHLFSSSRVKDKLAKRFATYGGRIFNRPISEASVRAIFR